MKELYNSTLVPLNQHGAILYIIRPAAACYMVISQKNMISLTNVEKLLLEII